MLARVLALLAPPLCGACSAQAPAGAPLCRDCARALSLAAPAPVVVAGADWAHAAAAYDGVARRLVAGLKFRGRLSLAEPMAASILAAAPSLAGMTVVPVPPSPGRRRRRGFDPADAIARALGSAAGRPLSRCLRRRDGPRQVGRARHERLASPPLVRAARPVPSRAVLVDDVVTTGATLTACAVALRAAGASEVGVLAFARSEDPRRRPIRA